MGGNAVKEVTIHTDGACSGNPGPGGWAAVLRYGEHTREMSGFVSGTTNNRMELMGVIEALRALKEPCRVKVCSDSAYLVNAFEKGWILNWQLNGWKTAAKQPVENKDLWDILLLAIKRRGHDVSFVKVPGHADNVDNNRCDELAKAAIRDQQSKETAAREAEAAEKASIRAALLALEAEEEKAFAEEE